MRGLWLLADSRLPTGGHAHSGGIEAAVRRGLVATPGGVASWLAGRVPTAGLVTAAASAAACALVAGPPSASGPHPAEPHPVDPHPAVDGGRPTPDWGRWDAAVSARTPVAALREVSRAQGRAMLRTVRTAWPHAATEALGARPHQALVLGVATAAAGGSVHDAAALSVHHLVGQICSGAVRLLGLDPLTLSAVHARALEQHAGVVDRAANAGAAAAARDDPDLLPSATTPLPEVLAVLHTRSEGALFAS